MRKILEKVYKTYGSEEKSGEPHHHKHIRNIAINWACQAHLPECLEDTKELFDSALIVGNFSTLSNDHRSSIMCNGVLNATRSVYETLYELYNSPGKSNSERVLILQTIGCIENEEVLGDYIKEYKNVSLSHWLTLIQSVYANGPIGLRVAQKFLKDNSEEFKLL